MTENTLHLWHSGADVSIGEDPLAVVRDGAVAHVVINRPQKRNALTAQIWQEIPNCMERFGKDDTVKLVVLRGAGQKACSRGADIYESPQVFGDPVSIRTYTAAVREAQLAVERFGKPVLAVVFGACVGGGCGLALACDMRFAAED